MTIKNIWKKKRLTVRIVKDKIIRTKRRIIAKQNKEAFEKYLASLGDNKYASLKNAKNNEKSLNNDAERNEKNSCSPQEDDNEKERSPLLPDHEKKNEEDQIFKDEERMRKIIKDKLDNIVCLGKVAHGIKDSEMKLILPIMQEQAISSAFAYHTENDFYQRNNVYSSTASVYAKNRSASRERKHRNRNYVITSPKYVETKKHYSGSQAFSRLSFTLSDDFPVEKSTKNIKQVEYKNFLLPTESYNNKVSSIYKEVKVNPNQSHKRYHKRKLSLQTPYIPKIETAFDKEQKTKKNPWIPVARTFSSYIIGLDNTSYKPEKHSPSNIKISLNKVTSKTSDTHSRIKVLSPVSPSIDKYLDRYDTLTTARTRTKQNSSITQSQWTPRNALSIDKF